jgi:NADH-quinone oxidoreductase subunit G
MANRSEASDHVTCTIDGREVSVPRGTTIIDAAEKLGIGIVHYCYHPALSAPAMCRMCLVQVEGAPKLVPACVSTVADGAVIRTDTQPAEEARTGVLEFYLLNHPLDCPVCDASGECKLQDYVHQEGRKHGRSREPKRVLGQDDFGGDVLYDGDRCIMCTRCVRYMREIAGDDQLCVVQRGSRSVIDTFFDDGLNDSPFASNIIDICPVGAFLSKDFLHKARAWDLDRTPSICPNCSQGCNITLDTRDNLVQRLKPRHNPDVNSYWMCDYGRYRYEWMNRGAAPYPYGMPGGPVPVEAAAGESTSAAGHDPGPGHCVGAPARDAHDAAGGRGRTGGLAGGHRRAGGPAQGDPGGRHRDRVPVPRQRGQRAPARLQEVVGGD